MNAAETIPSRYQSPELVLEVRGVSKSFPGVQALDNVDFTLHRGEVHVLVGENGAGKTTLVKILLGAYTKDSGTILVHGKEVLFRNPKDAVEAGIGAVYQEFSLVPNLSVAENIFLGRQATRQIARTLNWIEWPTLHAKTVSALAEFGVRVDPRAKVKTLGVATRQLVEIVKALTLNAKLLIMDEPTASLSGHEREHLFEVIRSLKSKGVSIVYISHRLEEIAGIGDRVTVLKDGRKVGTVDAARTSIDTIVGMMVGRDLREIFPTRDCRPGDVLLELKSLSAPGRYEDISLTIREGEIVGITGLIGAGKTELVRGIFGADRTTSGEIWFKGEKMRGGSPNQAIRLGMGLVPEDRREQGLILALNVKENIGLPSLRRFSRFGIINTIREARETTRHMTDVGIRPRDPSRKVSYLSGGNQQKVVVAKWLCSDSSVYIFDEPTRGIDIGAKAEVYGLMASLARAGSGVLMISSEVAEIVGMCDRIIVMHKGKVAAELTHETATQERILGAALRGVNAL